MMYQRYVLENICRSQQDATKGKAPLAKNVLKDIQSW